MRRSLLVLAFFLVPAAAQEEEFKWKALEHRPPAVGERYFNVDEEVQQVKSTITIGKLDPKEEESATTLRYRMVHETLAVEGGDITKERVAIERWSVQKKASDEEDKSLAGKAIIVTGKGEEKTVAFDGSAEGVSDQGKRWVEENLSRVDPMLEVEKLLPQEAVSPDGEWSIDPKKVADQIFSGAEIDAAKSSVKGKLENVKVENGVHVGDATVKVLLQLKYVPKAPVPVEWKEGGLVDIAVSIQGSLEPAKSRRRTVKMELKLKGHAEGKTDEGAVALTMDMKMTTNYVVGDMPKK